MSGFYKKYLLFALPVFALVCIIPSDDVNMIPLALIAIPLGVSVANEILKIKWNKKYVFAVEIVIFAVLAAMLFTTKIPRLILAYLLCVAYVHGGLMVRLKCIDRINSAFVISMLVISAAYSPLFYFAIVDVLSL